MTSLSLRYKIPGHWRSQASSGRLEQQMASSGAIFWIYGQFFLIELNLGLERYKDVLTKTHKWWLRNWNWVSTFLLPTMWALASGLNNLGVFFLIVGVRTICSVFPQIHSRVNISSFCDSSMNCAQEWGYLMVKNKKKLGNWITMNSFRKINIWDNNWFLTEGKSP